MEGGIERALFDAQEIFGGALDVEHDAVTVEIADAGESFEDEEIEGALEVILCQFVPLASLVWSDDTPSCMGMSSVVREQGTGNREQGTGNREQGTGNRKQETGNRKQETGNRKQETGNRD
jgi:hypothetical protein